MATAATERIGGHAMRNHQSGFDGHGSRQGSRVTSPSSRNATSQERNNGELPRAASYTYIPHAKEQRYGHPAVVDIKAFSESDYVAQDDADDISPPDTSPPDSSGWNTPDEHAPAIAPPQAREIIAHLQKSPTARRHDAASESTRSSVESSNRYSGTSVASTQTASTVASTPASSQHRPSINKSFSKRFSRQSWYQSAPSTPSRSPSPTKEEQPTRSGSLGTDVGAVPEVAADGRRKSLIARTLTNKATKEKKETAQSSDDQEPSRPTRKGTFLRKKSAQRNSSLSQVASNEVPAHATPGEDAVPALPTLPKSFSTDRLPMLRSQSAMSDRAAPVPRLLSSEKLHGPSPLSTATKKKDPLWSEFRSLDADYAKFSSKSTALKANVVRNALIPFLRTYAGHVSNKNLRPEDLDRRTNILNKWWTGLIELLHGRNNQSISGTDRPAILDGISGIMERSEWRLSPSPFCPLAERIRVTLSNGNRSNTSLGSSSSDFLTDSVHHNVRNIFIQNLSAQMAFVVDKMSLRNASASLVTFCGKACAYAFMFVPGMADVMVRLWDLPIDTLRRVLHENGVGKFEQMSEYSEDIVAKFPPAVQQLGFVSLMKHMKKLRTPPPLPLGTHHIEWWGHWGERWSGRESDLFYVFVKHFHILAIDFLPSDSTKKKRMCAPGMLLVHAQILSNLDATIHRDANHSQQDSTTANSSTTFDELLGDPDAVASALPVPPTNAIRLMAENRLIMLIRDFLSERTADHPVAREVFAQSFNDLLQAAARGTSMFDHSACYTLLDFLEEALVILVRYEQLRETEGPLLNSDFWHLVCRKMIDSENTMTEIRLYAFLYTIWNMVVANKYRKANLCMELLLDPDVFESRFNHWCPMVRAYYMRLLCWRVGRHDGEDGTDIELLDTLEWRLQTTWSHYVFLEEKASHEETLRPVTNPCNPAPGRRLVIVRTDNQITPGGSFLTFDGLLRDSPSQMQKPAWRRTSSASTLLDGIETRPDSSSSTLDSESDSREKGIGGFLRKMIGGGSKARSKSQGPSKRNGSPSSAPPLPEGAQGISRAATDGQQSGREPEPPKPQHRSLSFKFSLEFHPNYKQMPPMRLNRPRLPTPAQAYLQAQRPGLCESAVEAQEPRGKSVARARYSGRALAEWTMVVGECHSFFERRKNEGAPGNRHVETPTLGVEVFKPRS
ncbi:hypothetical protein M409DRAFT_66218 [Zasmidium cellare ATCC 36951]|uniref:DUF1765-domain-containing protein n=1 Tax=Zasmidium cellare ATCC 36951 TaxID=1080233 RepID=A0A6A6CMN8_ZASCE|nr:uncharacterized protein M409DRAFT_66218 [Zasmidium cellare ATCC 36951]KAF2167182.1 hypothetical protein M409DRAFT_66218 [Zasmidium cellare ATCC 36951]